MRRPSATRTGTGVRAAGGSAPSTSRAARPRRAAAAAGKRRKRALKDESESEEEDKSSEDEGADDAMQEDVQRAPGATPHRAPQLAARGLVFRSQWRAFVGMPGLATVVRV